MAESALTARIEIVSYQTNQVMDVIAVVNGADPDRVDRGVNINLDHEKFFTRIVRAEEPGE